MHICSDNGIYTRTKLFKQDSYRLFSGPPPLLPAPLHLFLLCSNPPLLLLSSLPLLLSSPLISSPPLPSPLLPSPLLSLSFGHPVLCVSLFRRLPLFTLV